MTASSTAVAVLGTVLPRPGPRRAAAIRSWTGGLAIGCTLLLTDLTPVLLGAGQPARAEERQPDSDQCQNWTSVPHQKPGKLLRLYKMTWPAGSKLQGSIRSTREDIYGVFFSKGDTLISIISDPEKDNWPRQFSVLKGTFLEFENRTIRQKLNVSGGTISPGDFDDVILPQISETWYKDAIECRQGLPPEMMEAPADRSSLEGLSLKGMSGAGGVPASTGKGATPPGISDRFYPRAEPGATGPPEDGAKEAAPPSLNGVFVRPPSFTEPTGAASTLQPLTPEPLEPKFAEPRAPARPPRMTAKSPDDAASGIGPAARGAEVRPVSPLVPVCHADTQASLAIAPGANPAPPAMVGLRNARTSVDAYDFIDVTGDALPLRRTANLSDSAGSLVAYQPVGPQNRAASGRTWVALAGLDATSLKRPGAGRPAAARRLRIMVVGGAQEVAISGLDKVGAEMRRQSREALKLSLEWRVVGASGALADAGRFDSFEDLVRAAGDRAAGRASDVLAEAQLAAFIDAFQTLLEGESRAVDRVFWVKGEYAVPSSFPARFDRFIAAASASSAVRRTPAGLPMKWLVVLTADMPGFSVGYLQEPVYRHQIGDVLREDRSSLGVARRLVTDPAGLAIRLLSAVPATLTVADEPGIGDSINRLVLDAETVFAQRGYLVAPEAVERLREALDRTSLALMTGAAAESAASRQPDPLSIVAALVRSDPPPPAPRWPRFLLDWVQKLSSVPRPEDHRDADLFLQKYRAGLDRLAGLVRSRRCSLVFVPESSLFPF